LKLDNIGFIIIFISLLGYISNYLNWHFLNYKLNEYLYYLGVFVHETSHALVAILTGAKVTEYKFITSRPRVAYYGSRIPLIGNLLISVAPIIGGLGFIFLLDKFFLNIYVMPPFMDWHLFYSDFIYLLNQIDLTFYKTYIIAFVFLNVGAMISPSVRDLKNVWPLMLLLIFIQNSFITHLGLLSMAFILCGILIQIVLIVTIFLIKKLNPF
jgi:hypothetical protein